MISKSPTHRFHSIVGEDVKKLSKGKTTSK